MGRQRSALEKKTFRYDFHKRSDNPLLLFKIFHIGTLCSITNLPLPTEPWRSRPDRNLHNNQRILFLKYLFMILQNKYLFIYMERVWKRALFFFV